MENPESVQSETPQEQTSDDSLSESMSEKAADQADQQTKKSQDTQEAEGDITTLQAKLEEKTAEAGDG